MTSQIAATSPRAAGTSFINDEPQTYNYDTSPRSISKDLDEEDDMNYNATTTSPEVVKEKKRKYSQGLYQWTRVMWESARQDIERRSSVSSTSSTSTNEPLESEKNTHFRRSTDDVAGNIGAVPAIH
ncbi:hypothetical protein CI109_101173 [Kwoniella shandongensis]|uniref:Uncharacterized protein n=1 Tax=Kwoniella shandongensis TaxID=1734106 RepID=A0A5M6C9Z9_9TREE|nr:uncharacterized protein CI109_001642 [Kwoniella shandongensis]KAA5530235.1 hypothetical protein CI109_001642 [Kwoniella shandongensis]